MTELGDIAIQELATNMILAPEDLLADIGPLGQLYFLNQLSWHVIRSFTGMLSADASAELEPDDAPVIALNQLAEATGMLDQVCITMGLIPVTAAVTQ